VDAVATATVDGWGAVTRSRARELRRNMTEAERRLWSAVRYGRIQGFKFRRQQPIGHYIVDFFCPQAKLIIEIDGSHHEDEEQAWYDYHRTKFLESKSYLVLRFRNGFVLKHPFETIDIISQALARPPIRPAVSAGAATSVHLPPRGGKGKQRERR
jgi:very-short-patch-repair endonuclease